MSFARKAALSLAVVAPLALGLAPAHAGNNGVSVAGTGTINPGIPCPASGCTLHLDFTAAFGGQDASGSATCTFDGTDSFPGGATVVSGSGSGTINCSGGVSASGTVTFTRTGTVVRVSGSPISFKVNGQGCTVDVTLAFAPLSANPTTTFAVTGGGTVTC
jgi:hypothetical protein